MNRDIEDNCDLYGRNVGRVIQSDGFAEVNYEEFSFDSVQSGVPSPSEMDCRALGNSVWVEVDGRGDCIRYWSAGLADETPCAVFYIHGDRLWYGKTSSYSDNNSMAQIEYAAQASASLNMAFVKIARPGLYGSSGSHSASRQMREMKLVAGAVREILVRHKIKRFGFTGQSGGGSVASYLLTQFPEVECVAFTAACLSLEAIKRAGQATGGYDYGEQGIYDPIFHLPEVNVDAKRRLFVIGDVRDRDVPFTNLADYFEAAKSAGHNVELVSAEGLGEHHILDVTGQHVIAWCLEGLTNDEIRSKVHNKEVVG